MPTYKNNTEEPITIRTKDESKFTILPTEEFATFFFMSDTGLELLTDTPLYNQVVNATKVTLSDTASEHLIDDDTVSILIIQITGTVTARPQTITAIPFLLEVTNTEPAILIERTYPYFNKLQLTGSGFCTVMEYRAIY